jgi:hypothetical protein
MNADLLISMLLEAKEHPLIRKAIKEFGLTDDPAEGGYILPSGAMLDFSGKREGGSPGMRAYDHRNINSIIDADYEHGIDYINHFIKSTGAVRMSYAPPGRGDSESRLHLHFTHPPTRAQRSVIADIKPDSLHVDVDHPVTGERLHSEDHDSRADIGSGLFAAYKKAEEHATN